MTLSHFETLLRYDDWGFRRLFSCLTMVDWSVLQEPAGLDQGDGSIWATVTHSLGAEQVWLDRCRGREPQQRLEEAGIPSVDALQSNWTDIAAGWSLFLSGIEDADLEKTVTNRSRSGVVF